MTLRRARFLALPAILAGCGQSPSFMRPEGAFARQEARLGWVLLAISAVVVIVVAVLVLTAALRRRVKAEGLVAPAAGETRWIIIGGAVVPVCILFAAFLFTLVTISAVTPPSGPPPLSIILTGHQWWWEVSYPDTQPDQSITTANEIHIPVGVAVRLELRAADVIHSFWVPELAGKTDLIPGQHNLAWIQADTAGVYRGMCAEYCGAQHGNMGLLVIAETPERFRVWRRSELASAAKPVDPDATAGRVAFEHSACVACHTIRGTGAAGNVGPDLTHIASRRELAAGTVPNSRGFLAGWIANPQAIKPGSHMPNVPLTAPEFQGVLAYLESLY